MAVNMDREVALDQAFDYVEAVEKQDISRVDGINREPSRTHRLLRSYARHQGSQASYGTIKADLIANESDNFDEDTIASYITALKKNICDRGFRSVEPQLTFEIGNQDFGYPVFYRPFHSYGGLGPGSLRPYQ